ncbi:MAG: 50S ribosomal protein L19 [Candidatus Sumerlaeota bacterium]
MNTLVREFEASQMKQDKFDFRPGDTVRVSVRIVESGKERLQDFEGVCIARHGGGLNETFTVRRISFGIGMERVFPLHSPRIEKIIVVRRGKVRRAKLDYLRQLRGKKARISEDIQRTRKGTLAGKEAAAQAVAEAEAQAAEEAEAKARAEAQAEQEENKAEESASEEE